MGNKGFFFATGRTVLDDGKGNKFFDVNEVAERVFNDFKGLPNNGNRLETMAFYIAQHSKSIYQDIAIQRPNELTENLVGGNLVKAMVGGTPDDGSLAMYMLNINVEPTTAPVPLIAFTVERLNIEVGDLFTIGSFEKNGVLEFIQNQTGRAKAANAQLEAELVKGSNPDAGVMRVKAAVQAAIDWANNNRVGGPLDILELKPGGTVNWIQRKQGCQ